MALYEVLGIAYISTCVKLFSLHFVALLGVLLCLHGVGFAVMLTH